MARWRCKTDWKEAKSGREEIKIMNLEHSLQTPCKVTPAAFDCHDRQLDRCWNPVGDKPLAMPMRENTLTVGGVFPLAGDPG